MFWLILFVLLLIMAVGGTVYLFTRFHRFSFMEKFGEKHKLLSWLACLIPLGGLACFGFINFYTVIVVVLHLIIFWLIADIIAAIVRKAAKKQRRRNIEGAAAILFTAVYLAIGWHNAHDVRRTAYELHTDKPLAGGSLRIAAIADPHLGITLNGDDFAREIERIQAEKPDMLVIAGDYVDDDSCREDMVRSCEALGKLDTKYGVYFIFGNHDKEANCDVNYLADVMMKSPHCVMQKGDPSMGAGNYIINICEDNDGEPVPVESLIMYYCRTPDAKKLMDWYAWAADGINKASGGKAETVVFSHIPIPEYIYGYNEAWDSENNRWKDGYKAYGELHEKICIDYDADGKPVLEGFFDVMKEHGTKYFFCSHDHMNDFSLEYKGIRLTYMMKLGYGSGFQIGFNGGTVIRIDKGIERITHKTVSTGIMKDIVDINTKA